MSECEAAACLIITLMIDDDKKKHVVQQESGCDEESINVKRIRVFFICIF